MRFWRALALAWLSSCSPLENGNDVFPFSSRGGGGSQSGEPGAGGAAGAGGSYGGGTSGGDGRGGLQGDAGVAAGGARSRLCPPADKRTLQRLGQNGELTLRGDTSWSCQNDYELVGNVIVAPGATLRIGPGVTVRVGRRLMLLAQRGARIQAVGTAEEPITVTSAKPEGSRAPGDYRGLILIGDGPSQTTTATVFDSLSDSRAQYGGGPAGRVDGSCGTLRYVRIEFAGGSVDDVSLPAGALTLAGCGSATVVDYVQVQRATDGVGLLGGTVGLKHIVVSNNFLGEAVEWSAGYVGTMQFIVAQSLGASAAMQGSNSAAAEGAVPVSRPTIYNATLVGSPPLVTGQHFGFVLQFGSQAVFKNSVIQGFADAAFDLRLPQSVLKDQLGLGKNVDISHALLHGNAALYSAQAQALVVAKSMRGQDPGLPAAQLPTPQKPDATPVFAPLDPTVNTDPASVPPGFDATAGFRGGVPQDGTDWTLGWTRFPKD